MKWVDRWGQLWEEPRMLLALTWQRARGLHKGAHAHGANRQPTAAFTSA